MKKLTFAQKLWLPLYVSLVCMTATTGFDAWSLRDVRIEERKNDLANNADNVVSLVSQYADLERRGALSRDAAQQEALERIKGMRFGKDGYYTVMTDEPKMLMHPFRQELVGKVLGNFKDANGTPLYRDAVNVAKANGSGFIRYVWPRPGEERPAPKLTRVATFKPWGWIFLNGVYIDDIDRAFYRSLLRSGCILAVAALVLSIIVVLLNRALRRSLGGDPAVTAEAARRIAGGDLSMPVDTRGAGDRSVLYAIEEMRNQLAHVVGAIKNSAESIRSATQEIAVGNGDLSQRTEEQAASLQETTSSMEQITSMVTSNADNALRANELAGTASEIADRGGEVVGKVVGTMQDISDSSAKIAEIVGVIEGIAFQTNILALNAAVEAARAGEQGRGFAVVASEVRGLALRAAAAAKDVKLLVQDSVSRVNGGSALVSEAGAAIREIVGAVKRVDSIIHEIAAASSEQSTGIQEVGKAISQMDAVTQQNAALVEQAAAAAQSLSEQANGLARVVATFRLPDADHGPEIDVEPVASTETADVSVA
ncbi:methyl-accepting chemotaxis protein [Paraburkholderia xenovorans]